MDILSLIEQKNKRSEASDYINIFDNGSRGYYSGNKPSATECKSALPRFSARNSAPYGVLTADGLKCSELNRMAIYHLHISSGSRSNGQSANAKIDYINREGKYKDRPDNVLASGDQLPEWATSRNHFWRGVDQHERANAKLFMEVEFALPIELNLEQQKDLVEKFAQTNIPKQPYSWAIHEGKGTNPHCHLVFNERTMDGVKRDKKTFFKRANKKNPEKGGAAKKRYLKSTDFLKSIRKSWESHANQALKECNKKGLIDCRTLKAQGIDREPQVHIGPNRLGRIERELKAEKNGENDNQKWSEEVIQRIARRIAESEARGRRNRLEIDKAAKFFGDQSRRRIYTPDANIDGVEEFHGVCAEAFVYAQDRGRSDQLRHDNEQANERNRKAIQLNRREIQRDRERGRRLRQRQSQEYIRGIIKFFRRSTRHFLEQIGSVGEKFNVISWRIIEKNNTPSSPRKAPGRSQGNDHELRF